MNFLEQLEQLRLRTPLLALSNALSTNSDYCTYARENKNCYLLFGSDFNQECLYGLWVYRNRDCLDCSFLYDSELCYESIDCRHCYGLNFCQDCRNTSDCEWCYNLVGCDSCFGCVNLRQKKYHIFNQPCSREEYGAKISELRKLSRAEIFQRFSAIKEREPHVYMHQYDLERSTGDYVYNSKNCLSCFDVHDSEDCLYINNAFKMKDCVDVSYAEGELMYECMSTAGYNLSFCNVCWYSSDLEYCDHCFSCKHCFGCVGLRQKEYYILNRPYSPSEYSAKLSEIKAEMRTHGIYGKHLPSPYPIEDTWAQ